MWTKVGKNSDVEEGKSLIVAVNGHEIALFKISGAFYAMENFCPHRGGPLGEGHVDGTEVTCPWHAWTFDVKSGACLTDPSFQQKKFPVKIENDEILVDASN